NAGEKLAKVPAARALAAVSLDRGCLAPAASSGVPHFDLNPTQRRAIAAAFGAMKSSPGAETAAQKIDWQMMRLNCYACHVRAGKGGPEPARAQFFTVNDPGAESLGEMAHLPPNLDCAGRKLTQDWFGKILWGEDGAVRPYMN